MQSLLAAAGSQQTKRAATNPRPPLERSWRGESRSACYIFVKLSFEPFFKITFQTMPEQKCTKQNQIRLVGYSCSEVSDPSDVPRFVGELIF